MGQHKSSLRRSEDAPGGLGLITIKNRLFSARRKLKRGDEQVWDYISDCTHFVIVTDCLATERRVSLICRGFQFLFYIYYT